LAESGAFKSIAPRPSGPRRQIPPPRLYFIRNFAKLDLLGGMIHLRLFVKKMRVDDRVLTRAVDTLVDGIGGAPLV
jgi:hypothetical protein